MLALSHCAWNDWDGSQSEFLQRIAPKVPGDIPQYPWYADHSLDQQFPFEQETISIKLLANVMRAEMKHANIACSHLCARVVLERELNQMIENTRNKGSRAFLDLGLSHRSSPRTFGDRGLVLFCDRQGGREHYGSLLRLMFDEWSLEDFRRATKPRPNIVYTRRNGQIAHHFLREGRDAMHVRRVCIDDQQISSRISNATLQCLLEKPASRSRPDGRLSHGRYAVPERHRSQAGTTGHQRRRTGAKPVNGLAGCRLCFGVLASALPCLWLRIITLQTCIKVVQGVSSWSILYHSPPDRTDRPTTAPLPAKMRCRWATPARVPNDASRCATRSTNPQRRARNPRAMHVIAFGGKIFEDLRAAPQSKRGRAHTCNTSR